MGEKVDMQDLLKETATATAISVDVQRFPLGEDSSVDQHELVEFLGLGSGAAPFRWTVCCWGDHTVAVFS